MHDIVITLHTVFISQPVLNGVYCLALKEEGPGGGVGGGAGGGSGEGDRFVLLLL